MFYVLGFVVDNHTMIRYLNPQQMRELFFNVFNIKIFFSMLRELSEAGDGAVQTSYNLSSKPRWMSDHLLFHSFSSSSSFLSFF